MLRYLTSIIMAKFMVIIHCRFIYCQSTQKVEKNNDFVSYPLEFYLKTSQAEVYEYTCMHEDSPDSVHVYIHFSIENLQGGTANSCNTSNSCNTCRL